MDQDWGQIVRTCPRAFVRFLEKQQRDKRGGRGRSRLCVAARTYQKEANDGAGMMVVRVRSVVEDVCVLPIPPRRSGGGGPSEKWVVPRNPRFPSHPHTRRGSALSGRALAPPSTREDIFDEERGRNERGVLEILWQGGRWTRGGRVSSSPCPLSLATPGPGIGTGNSPPHTLPSPRVSPILAHR
jgi:hypothetical protein